MSGQTPPGDSRATEQGRDAEQGRDVDAFVEELQSTLESAADGDLSSRAKLSFDDPELANTVETLNDLLASLEYTFATVDGFATDVGETSHETTRSVEDVRGETEAVHRTAREISGTTEEQQRNVEELSTEMGNVSATIEEITATAASVAEQSERTATRGTEGQQTAQQAIEQLDVIESDIEEAKRTAGELTDRTVEIDDVLEFVSDIAEQTNLLALNASIEAARAGEAGDGFEVVAEEIKDLAEETKEATDRIGDLLREVHDRAEDTEQELERTAERVSTGAETIESALDSLDEIAESAAETNDGVREIDDATAEQARAAQDVSEMTDELTELAEETAARADRVLDAVRTQDQEVSRISHEVKTLAAQTTVLEEQLDGFEYQSVGGVELLDSETRTDTAGVEGTSVVIGSKPFTANKVLAYLAYELLEVETDLVPVDAVGSGITDENFRKLTEGELDLYWEYTGTIYGQFLDATESVTDPDRLHEAAKSGIESKRDLRFGARAEYNNTYTILAPRVWCEQTGVDSLDALARFANDAEGELTAVVGPDFCDREDGWKGLLAEHPFEPEVRERIWARTETVEPAEKRYEAINRSTVDVTMGLTVDALIDVHDLVQLDDDRQFFPIYNPAPLVRKDIIQADPDAIDTLNRLGPTLEDVTEMRRLVRQVDIGKRHPRVVAREHLERKRLL
ncbi:glycine betaine ABC transporter substrate-binding protein [Halalkaliarchaeum sp. AArc-GB]|uniref:glycine betaine ABC transporter substrate-binding protein n=1 Tax=Halalkaliarchaeum sp. AArc-GB TaxID=3074078 RepID=UPI00285863E0|nr:glycine betaine ABC transporter substrate-binding protein [Halalkaliarchaeum sp. AArc-GB]MDR5673999.1 glycine betaine ABC transporter substrate-binding protein [Halalkaliarchaeum sp. AArc-GB]